MQEILDALDRASVTESSVMLALENQGAAYARTKPRHLRHSGHLLYAGLPTLHDANENSGRVTCRRGSWRSDIRVPKMPLRSYVGLQTIQAALIFSKVSSRVGLSQSKPILRLNSTRSSILGS